MVSALEKDQNQQVTGHKAQSQEIGAQARAVVDKTRTQHQTQKDELAILNAVKVSNNNSTNQSGANSSYGSLGNRNRERRSDRTKEKAATHKERAPGGETTEHEREESIAFRYNNPFNRSQASTVEEREKVTDAWAAIELDPEAKEGLGEKAERAQSLGSPLVSGDGTTEQQAASQRFATDGPFVSQTALDQQALDPAEIQSVSLQDLVGPDAILTSREKQVELWKILDESGTTPLDVLAHMPVNIQGASAIELLMVESPQGIYFVSFLRNSNDFELLATFNKHALLPSNYSRQLAEAAMNAFQQIQTIAGTAAANMQEVLEKLLEEAAEKEIDEMVQNGVRKCCINAKRIKEYTRRMLDFLVEQLEAGLPEHGDTAPASNEQATAVNE